MRWTRWFLCITSNMPAITAYEGEQHNFWEFLYVDKGELHVRAGNRELTMKRGRRYSTSRANFTACVQMAWWRRTLW